MLRTLLIALAVVAHVRAFHIPFAATSRRALAAESVAPARAPVAAVQMRMPNAMDDGVFQFNKFLIDTVYDVICLIYNKNDLSKHSIEQCASRFYVLETVARVPYFGYLSVMHLKETFGNRAVGDKDRMRTHYAEADNELHHLLIMESLGGNSSLFDRTLAQSMAFGYYWYVVGVYSFSEQAAYHLSELIEDHAYNTYDKFLSTNEDTLRKMPVPAIARKYYEEENPFMFDLFCTVKEAKGEPSSLASRPKLESLYDVFVNVRNDEREHWKTLCNLVQYEDMRGVGQVVSSTRSTPKELVAVGAADNSA